MMAATARLEVRVRPESKAKIALAEIGVSSEFDEPQHIGCTDFAGGLGDNGEEHPQVIGGRQHRVRPAPPRQELQIVIEQRHPQPQNWLTRRATRTGQTGIQRRHLRNLLLDTQPATMACQNVHQDYVHNKQETVRKSALYDALTGLPNRQLFLKQLEHALALWQRSRTPFAVLFLDLDGFKLINDSLGHQMGDRVLTAVGAGIMRELRSVDTGARFGGDEFVILLADTDPGGAVVVAQRVQAALAEVHDFDGHQIATQASMGIATSAIEYTSAEDVLRDADTAMYRAKLAEPGTVAFFDVAMHASALRQQSLHREIHRALQENQFEVHYQPIVNLASGRADRFEALVRWRHPERGLVLPEEFLPVMEDSGLIVQLGHWILTEVCRQLVTWGPGVVNVSINVSDGEFWRQDLLTHVLETLRAHDLTADRLTLEITEGVLMRRPEVALRMMRKMHEAGSVSY